MTKKILFDHQKFTTQKYGGISRYFANIIQSITEKSEFDYDLGLLYSNNQYINRNRLIFNKYLNKTSFNIKEKYASKLNQAYSKHLIEQNNYDILHPTYYDPYFLGRTKKPLVITIHDMTYERLSEYFWAQDPLTYYKRLNIERADKIIAISETTKKDLIEYFDVDPTKIEVIYHGIDLESPVLSTPISNLPENYLLFVGDRSGYKNFYLFINAFKQLSVKFPDLNVILTGGGNLGCAEQELLLRLNISKKVFHVNVCDEELNYLYQNTLLFIYPSLHEGFGLPILEAYKAGCPVLLSDTECFREIAKDSATYFEPHSKEDLIYKIEGILQDSTFKANTILKQNGRLKDFPLSKSIDQTLNLYSLML